MDKDLAPWNGEVPCHVQGKCPSVETATGWCPVPDKDGKVSGQNGQSCFWFSQGCFIGCETCDGGNASGTNPNVRDRCNSGAKATLNPELRTYNKHTVPGSPQDIYKHNPWRSPGTARAPPASPPPAVLCAP